MHKSRFFYVKIQIMETLTVTILEPKAKQLLDDLANLNLIKVQKIEEQKEEKEHSAV